MSKKISTSECINDFVKKHGKKYDYSLVEYENAKKKLKIICHLHGIFLTNRNAHLDGNGCPTCGKISMNRVTIAKQKSTIGLSGKSLFEEKYEKIHKTRKSKNLSYHFAGLKAIETKKSIIDKNNQSLLDLAIEKATHTKIKKGLWTHPDHVPVYEKYKRKIEYQTQISLREYGDLIGYDPSKRKIKLFHVDHKFSIINGFRNSIPSEKIGLICNLQFITCNENWTKNHNNSITSDELDLLINEFNNSIR